MTHPGDGNAPGCRPTLAAGGAFLFAAVVLFALGLVVGLDRRAAYPLLFAGAPVTGLVTALGGDLAFAWPLDVTVWLVLGFVPARWAEHPRRFWGAVAAILTTALAYGALMSLLVEPT